MAQRAIGPHLLGDRTRPARLEPWPHDC